MDPRPICKGKKKDGTPCQSRVVLSNGYCSVHQGQAARGEQRERRRVTLTEFIEENHKLLTVLGVFTALTAFALNLPRSVLTYMLSSAFMALSILLWVQLVINYHLFRQSVLLALFSSLFNIALVLILTYWLVEFRLVLQQYLHFILAAAVFVASIVLITRTRLSKLFHRLNAPFLHRDFAFRARCLTAVYVVVLASVSCLMALWFAPHLNLMLDEMYEHLELGTYATPPAIAPAPAATVLTRTLVPSLTPTVRANTTPTVTYTPTPLTAPTEGP